jgi:hypothetical protein
VRPQDFTRQRQLTFPLPMLFVLQQTVKSIQRHWHEFLDDLAQGEIFEPVTSGAVTHARAKCKDIAFSELNRDGVLPTIYGPEHPIQRWRGHRLVGLDSSLVRLPDSQELGQAFGWKEAANQHGATGTRYPEARLSVVYDVRNRAGWDARLEPSTLGEVALALPQLEHWQPGDIAINDRGFSGDVYFARVWRRAATVPTTATCAVLASARPRSEAAGGRRFATTHRPRADFQELSRIHVVEKEPPIGN